MLCVKKPLKVFKMTGNKFKKILFVVNGDNHLYTNK